MEFVVILKIRNVEKDDLAAIAKHADDTVRHYVVDETNFHEGSSCLGVKKCYRTITLRKVTPVTDEPNLPGTMFSIELEIKRETVDENGRPMDTPLQWVTRIFEILERFPEEPSALDERSGPGTPPCRNCGSPTVPQCGMFLCLNCGEENRY